VKLSHVGRSYFSGGLLSGENGTILEPFNLNPVFFNRFFFACSVLSYQIVSENYQSARLWIEREAL